MGQWVQLQHITHRTSQGLRHVAHLKSNPIMCMPMVSWRQCSASSRCRSEPNDSSHSCLNLTLSGSTVVSRCRLPQQLRLMLSSSASTSAAGSLQRVATRMMCCSGMFSLRKKRAHAAAAPGLRSRTPRVPLSGGATTAQLSSTSWHIAWHDSMSDTLRLGQAAAGGGRSAAATSQPSPKQRATGPAFSHVLAIHQRGYLDQQLVGQVQQHG